MCIYVCMRLCICMCVCVQDSFQDHMKFAHAPGGSQDHNLQVGVGIVVQRKSDGRYLFVQEFCSQG